MSPTRHARSLAPLLAAALITGCSDCVGLPGTIAAAPSGTPAMMPALLAPSTAPAVREGRVIDGVARYFGEPMRGAEVTVHALGTRSVLATSTAGPDGNFQVVLPIAVPSGTIVELVAVAGGRRVASATTAPAERELLQRAGRTRIVLDEAQTTALMVLGPRIVAAIQLGSPEATRKAMESFVAAAEALGSENAASLLSPKTFDAAVAKVLDTIGEIIQAPEAREAVAAAIPEAVVSKLVAQADTLAETIRQEVGKGQPRPAEELLVALPIGPAIVPPVFADPNSPTDDPGASTSTSSPTTTSGGGGSGGDSVGNDDPPPLSPIVQVTTPDEGKFGKPSKPIAGGAQ